jgi:selenocysteine lyase/cysteine desulfurase
LLPWRLPELQHVEVRRTQGPLGTNGIADLVDDRTAAIIVSHVDGITGYRHDLAELAAVAHRHGAVLVVDAAQSVGAVNVDVERDGFDLLVGLSMKWLLGPPGIGFLYARPGLLDATPPPQLGYLGTRLDDDGNLLHVDGAKRHELGIGNLIGYAGFRAALELVAGVGIEAIESRVMSLAEHTIRELTARDLTVLTPAGSAHAGVVALRTERAQAAAAFLRARQVDVWGYADGRIRVDPHAFNTSDDIERFVVELDAFLAGERSGRRPR